MIERSELMFFKSLVYFLEAKICVEVGVAHGDGTLQLCEAAKYTGGHVFGFDIWEKHGIKKQFSSFSNKDTVERKLLLAGFSNFTLTKIDTIKDRKLFENKLDELCKNRIDFAFIDGCHSYLGIWNDFCAIYPRMSPNGIIAFHDTLMIDGCREFVFDLRTKFYDGTFDIVDFPFGCHSKRRIGISLLVKRSFPINDIPIYEICGSVSSPKDIEKAEISWYNNELNKNKINMKAIKEIPKIKVDYIGTGSDRRKFD